DAEETEANQFAVELLTGFKTRSYNYGSVNSIQLAMVAQAVGCDTDVSPGFIALSHGRVTGNWGAANGALKIIEGSPVTLTTVRLRLLQYLNREMLSRDCEEFLMRVTGA